MHAFMVRIGLVVGFNLATDGQFRWWIWESRAEQTAQVKEKKIKKDLRASSWIQEKKEDRFQFLSPSLDPRSHDIEGFKVIQTDIDPANEFNLVTGKMFFCDVIP